MIQNLQRELNQLRKSTDVAQVDNAIASLQQLVTKPAGLFDPYTVMSALEQVVSVAMEKRDNRAERYGIILKQAMPLIGSPALRSVLIKLVASKEEAEVAKAVEKALKHVPEMGRVQRQDYSFSRGRRSTRGPVRCYACGKFGHIARLCNFKDKK